MVLFQILDLDCIGRELDCGSLISFCTIECLKLLNEVAATYFWIQECNPGGNRKERSNQNGKGKEGK